ncbi:MAG: zinc ribbon domain-containing protein [Coriobacteriales bacterium]|nr:zinc ribbon domain-containing protein [Coriobacteriales bacterium]
MKYCEQCGSPVRDDARFCSKCGARLDGSGPQANTSTHDAAGKSSPVLWVGLAVVVVAAAVLILSGTGAFGGGASTPSKSVTSVAANAGSNASSSNNDKSVEAQKATAAQAWKKAYNALLDQSGGTYVGYTLVEMSGDDIPELILKPDTSENLSYNNFPAYAIAGETATKAGEFDLHLNRGSLHESASEHKVYSVESHGELYWRRYSVQGTALVTDQESGYFTDKSEMLSAGLTEVTWYDLSDRSALA